MFESTFFYFLSAVGYFFGFVFYLLHLVGSPKARVVGPAGPSWLVKETRWGSIATWVTVAAFSCATLGVIFRVIELWRVSGFFLPMPVTNTYETFAFFAWVIPLAYLLFEWRYKIKALGAFAIGLSFLFVALASSPIVADKGVNPLVPALQSYWLVAHVVFTIVGEGFFAIAFLAGALFLWQSWRARSEARGDLAAEAAKPSAEAVGITAVNPSAEAAGSTELLKKLDEIGYKAIAIGFPFFTLGALIFGMVWAQHAWGRYWGWDPKEVWSLITWLVYALYLHARVTWGWRDHKTAWLAVLGFFVVLFTWLGVNYLLSGLHSYA